MARDVYGLFVEERTSEEEGSVVINCQCLMIADSREELEALLDPEKDIRNQLTSRIRFWIEPVRVSERRRVMSRHDDDYWPNEASPEPNRQPTRRRTVTRRPSDRGPLSPPTPSPVFFLLGFFASVLGLVLVGLVTFVAWRYLGWRDTLPGVALMVGFGVVGYATVAEWLGEGSDAR